MRSAPLFIGTEALALDPARGQGENRAMTTESTYRAVAIASIALCLPIGLYYRIKSQATRERLDRRQEGVFVMVGLRLCGVLVWALFVAYLINPSLVSWCSVTLPAWLRWGGAPVALLVCASFLVVDVP